MTIQKDPIVEEVRRIRQARAAKFGFNVRKIAADAKKREKKLGARLVNSSKTPRSR